MTADEPGAQKRPPGALVEGWRLFLPYAREVMTPGRRRTLAATVVAGGVGGAAVFYALVPGFGSGWARILMAIAAGIGVVAIATWIETFLWRPPIATSQKFWGSMAANPEVDQEILVAYRAGREPNATVRQRLAAADRAERSQLGLQRALFTLVAPPALFPAFVLAAVAVLIDSGGQSVALLGGVGGLAATVFNPAVLLVTLGRTQAAIATRPVGVEPEPEKPRKPYRVLGTDHPSDYS